MTAVVVGCVVGPWVVACVPWVVGLPAVGLVAPWGLEVGAASVVAANVVG